MKMMYVTVRSGLETVEGAYLGQFVSNGTKFLDEITAAMCRDRPAVDEPEARLAIRALAAEIREKVGEGHFRVNMGDISFEPAISGSLPAMDSALSDDNQLYVNIVASDAIKKAIGSIVPTRDSSSAIKVLIDTIEDVASHRSLIVGTQEFLVTGRNLSARLEGESMALLRTDGSVAAAVTVSEVDGAGQRIYAQLAAAVPAGTYLLQITTRGYSTPDAGAESYTKRVVVLAGTAPVVPAPTITGAGTHGCEPGTVEAPGGVVEMTGTNLESATSIDFLVGDDGAPVEEMELWQTLEATWDSEGEVLVTDESVGESAPGSAGVLRVTTAGGTATYPVQYTVH